MGIKARERDQAGAHQAVEPRATRVAVSLRNALAELPR